MAPDQVAEVGTVRALHCRACLAVTLAAVLLAGCQSAPAPQPACLAQYASHSTYEASTLTSLARSTRTQEAATSYTPELATTHASAKREDDHSLVLAPPVPELIRTSATIQAAAKPANDATVTQASFTTETAVQKSPAEPAPRVRLVLVENQFKDAAAASLNQVEAEATETPTPPFRQPEKLHLSAASISPLDSDSQSKPWSRRDRQSLLAGACHARCDCTVVDPPPALAGHGSTTGSDNDDPNAPPTPVKPNVDMGYGHASDYSWLSGRLEYVSGPDPWRLRYAAGSDHDPYGGRVVLTGCRHLSRYSTGQLVRVVGHLSDPQYFGPSPVFMVQTIHPLGQPPSEASPEPASQSETEPASQSEYGYRRTHSYSR